MQETKNAAAEAGQRPGSEPLTLRKRIGPTTFIINVYASPSATETPEQKMLRVIEREVRNDNT